MAAIDTFEDYLAAFSTLEPGTISETVAQSRAELLAARSEEARIRLVHAFIRETHDRLSKSRETHS